MRPVSSMSFSRSTTGPRSRPIEATFTVVPSLYSKVVLTQLASRFGGWLEVKEGGEVHRGERESRQKGERGGESSGTDPLSSASVSSTRTQTGLDICCDFDGGGGVRESDWWLLLFLPSLMDFSVLENLSKKIFRRR